MFNTLSAGAVTLALGLAAAAPAAAVSTFESADYMLIGAELVLFDGEFETGPLTGEEFVFSVFFNDEFTAIDGAIVDIGVGATLPDFTFDVALVGSDADSLSLLATDFFDGSFPQGLSIVLSGFGFSAPVLEEFRTAFLDGNDIDFTGGLTTTVAPVPLPAAAWMLIAGVGALVAAGRRRA